MAASQVLTTFVALRHAPRIPEKDSHEAIVERRKFIRRRKQPGERAQRMLDAGLVNWTPDDGKLSAAEVRKKQAELEPGQAAFIRLAYAGAYVVYSMDDDKKEKARAILSDVYHIVPNSSWHPDEHNICGQTVSSEEAIEVELWPDECGIEQAHDQGLTGEGVLIGVLDVGFNPRHKEFLNRKHTAWMDVRRVPGAAPVGGPNLNWWHGTSIASICCGSKIGIAPGAHCFVATIADDGEPDHTIDHLLIALEHTLDYSLEDECIEMPLILNLSVGIPHVYNRFWKRITLPKEFRQIIESLRRFLERLEQEYSALSICAVGNDGAGEMLIPANFPQTLAVGAIDYNHARWENSGSGQFVDSPSYFAPDGVAYGVDVTAADGASIDKYIGVTGTSASASVATGIAALVSQRTGLQGRELREYLVRNALHLPLPRQRVGSGLIRC